MLLTIVVSHAKKPAMNASLIKIAVPRVLKLIISINNHAFCARVLSRVVYNVKAHRNALCAMPLSIVSTTVAYVTVKMGTILSEICVNLAH